MFLYYFPNLTQLSRADVQTNPVTRLLFWDLCKSDFLFQTRTITHQVLNNGPDGGAGILLIALPKGGTPTGFKVGYYPDRQKWVRVSEQNYWVGTCGQVSEESLRREFLVEGEEHELGDGQVWFCPIVRRRGKMALPSKWGIDPETSLFAQRVLEEYSDSWRVACEAWDHVMGDASIDKPRAFEICVCALSVNYRIGPVEATILGLIDDTNYDRVFGALIDRAFWEQTLLDQQEKKA